MTQSQINYFLAVASDGSITRAANRLFVSQPAISKSISALEKELGFALFSRRDNSITLTYAGRQLFEFFTRTKDEYRRLLKQIDRRGEQTATHIRIGCPSNWNPEMFYKPIVEHFAAVQPNLTLAIECFSIPEMIAMLKNKQLDLILTLDLRDSTLLGLRSRQIAETGCGILYSKQCFKNVESIADLRDAQFLGCDSNVQSQFESMIREACGGAFEPEFKHCANYHTAVFELSRGDGVMLFIDWDSAVRSELFDFLPLQTGLRINAVHLDENEAAAAFAEELAALFENRAQGKCAQGAGR